MEPVTMKCAAFGCENMITGGPDVPAVCPAHPTSVATVPGSGGEEHIMQFFAFAHLPERLQAISREFHRMASGIVGTIPRNPERTVALRKLLESKDAAVRAALAK